MRDQTDAHGQLVFENEWLITPNEAPLTLSGNVFFVEDTLSHTGLVFLKLAPLPHARPVKSDRDAECLPAPDDCGSRDRVIRSFC